TPAALDALSSVRRRLPGPLDGRAPLVRGLAPAEHRWLPSALAPARRRDPRRLQARRLRRPGGPPHASANAPAQPPPPALPRPPGPEAPRTRPPTHPANPLPLPFRKEVLGLQHECPRAGRFRVRGLLAQRLDEDPPSERTVGRAMALNREHHGAPAAWVTNRPDPVTPDGGVKFLPYPPTDPHPHRFIHYHYLRPLHHPP